MNSDYLTTFLMLARTAQNEYQITLLSPYIIKFIYECRNELGAAHLNDALGLMGKSLFSFKS